MLESILLQAGYRVGVYSTPHLRDYNERIRLDGRNVSDALLTGSFARIDAARESTSLSYFEFGTLAALDIFAQQAVDIQILEVGLGGRLDAVNIIDANAALITTIDVDHVDWLGTDISNIALEKAGVFRAQQKAVCADKSVPQSLVDYAASLNTDLLLAGKDFEIKEQASSWSLLAKHALAGSYVKPALAGAHQLHNAAGVISLLAHIATDIPLDKACINAGLSSVCLAGRLQRLAGLANIYLDVAHNEQSAHALAKFIASTYPQATLHVVFSSLVDKDLDKILKPFVARVDHWHIAPLQTHRAQDIDKISAYLEDNSNGTRKVYPSVGSAFLTARHAMKKDDLLVCFGSFYVVEACLDAL